MYPRKLTLQEDTSAHPERKREVPLESLGVELIATRNLTDFFTLLKEKGITNIHFTDGRSVKTDELEALTNLYARTIAEETSEREAATVGEESHFVNKDHRDIVANLIGIGEVKGIHFTQHLTTLVLREIANTVIKSKKGGIPVVPEPVQSVHNYKEIGYEDTEQLPDDRGAKNTIRDTDEENYAEVVKSKLVVHTKNKLNPFTRGVNRIIGRVEKAVTTLEKKAMEGRKILRGLFSGTKKPEQKVNPDERLRTVEPILFSEEEARARLNTITTKTENKRLTLLESANEYKKKILERIEYVGERFNHLPKSVRYGGGITLAAIASSGTPFVIPAIALGTAFKMASGAALYTTINNRLNASYKKIETTGKKVSTLRKGTMQLGAVAVAAFTGYALGQYLQGLLDLNAPPLPTHETPITFDTVSDDVTPAYIVPENPDIVSTEIPPDRFSDHFVEPQEVVPSSIHKILPDEKLWDIVKNHLMGSEAFKNLSGVARNLEISKYLAYIDQQKILPDVNVIQPGDIIDFSKIDGHVPPDILKKVNPFI